jgi:hypothetical protein
MYASGYVFQQGFFDAWVVVSIIWVWITMLIAGFYPIIDGRKQIIQVYRGLFRKGSREDGSSDGVATPVETEKSVQVADK